MQHFPMRAGRRSDRSGPTSTHWFPQTGRTMMQIRAAGAPAARDAREAAMYRLYWSRNTGAFAPDLVLQLAGVPCERILVDRSVGEHRQPEYLRLNPMGEVPTLVLPDGTVLTESAAMLLHLVDAHPQAGLAPPPGSADRTRFDRWVLFTAVNL